ncbi:hypothetical protein P20652_3270 [Pseudoalteromonas sp. BSi20652]|uniref:DUF7010 family protein n=1 Tax=Pseudoalteromonas sp. BSi20652 TaxID=388384 RepID=UPI000231A695|nr:hypothetical protein [Pseudoalteromonas sp. BSi20652]GAA61393.1 hypothetical protein P20652_3270 [Pseudoalteromonas sp. BSi20652]
MTLDEYRKEFEKSSNRSISMPVAGAIIWSLVGLLSTQFSANISIYILLFQQAGFFL